MGGIGMGGARGTGSVWHLTLRAGPRPRHRATLVAEAPSAVADGAYRLVYAGGEVAAQVEGGRLYAVVPEMAAGEEREADLVPSADPPRATARQEGDRVVVAAGGTLVGELLLAAGPKPFFYPLLLPNGQAVTRRVPPDPEAGDVVDHPHHKGFWVGHGDVSGVDLWADDPRRLGRQLVRAVRTASGPVAARVELDLDWVGPEGTVAVSERRVYRFWETGPSGRVVDLASTYRAPADRAAVFGDTKEGALCCIRLAAGMEGNRGGLITQSTGARTEAEAWGRPAAWCDYSGAPFGPDGRSRQATVGVALFDHPDNPLYPTRWHVRDYGLFTVNPFALHDYLPGRGLDGAFAIPAGQEATFRFRLFAHVGDAQAADVAGRFADWAWPIRVAWAGGARGADG
jgi:hypothetical protein